MAAVSNMPKKETIVVLTFFMLSIVRWKISSCSGSYCFQQASRSKLRWAKSGALIGTDLPM